MPILSDQAALDTQLYLIMTSHFEHPTWQLCWPPDLTSHYIYPHALHSHSVCWQLPLTVSELTYSYE
jgi:hypothetical protein